MDTVVVQDGSIARQTATHVEWIVAEQDCNLAGADLDAEDARIEIRPVYVGEAPIDWGIRSRRFRLDEAGRFISDQTPKVLVSPAVLSAVAATMEPPLIPERALGFKTWLGRRYDRPAVPDHLVPLAKVISKRIQRPGGRSVALRVRDVLMQFDDSKSPPHFALFAVLEDGADSNAAADTRNWLAGVALAVPAELGIGASFQVGTAMQTSLHLLETSYAADASQLTWSGIEPQGAV